MIGNPDSGPTCWEVYRARNCPEGRSRWFFKRNISYGVKNWFRSRQHSLKHGTAGWHAKQKVSCGDIGVTSGSTVWSPNYSVLKNSNSRTLMCSLQNEKLVGPMRWRLNCFMLRVFYLYRFLITRSVIYSQYILDATSDFNII